MESLLKKLYEAKEKENIAKEERMEVEAEIYNMIEGDLDDDKSLTYKFDKFKLSVKPTYSVKVDQEKAVFYPGMFKIKYEMTYSQYKKVGSIVDDMITINTTKPSFKVEAIND